jgi:hypothetical protein
VPSWPIFAILRHGDVVDMMVEVKMVNKLNQPISRVSNSIGANTLANNLIVGSNRP